MNRNLSRNQLATAMSVEMNQPVAPGDDRGFTLFARGPRTGQNVSNHYSIGVAGHERQEPHPLQPAAANTYLRDKEAVLDAAGDDAAVGGWGPDGSDVDYLDIPTLIPVTPGMGDADPNFNTAVVLGGINRQIGVGRLNDATGPKGDYYDYIPVGVREDDDEGNVVSYKPDMSPGAGVPRAIAAGHNPIGYIQF